MTQRPRSRQSLTDSDDESRHRPSAPGRRARSRSRHRDNTQESYSSSSQTTSRRVRSTSRRRNNDGVFASSATLLAGIGVAALVAHNFWPKGILYSAQEEWEKKKRQERKEQDHRQGSGGHRRGRSIMSERDTGSYSGRPRHRSEEDARRRREPAYDYPDMRRDDRLAPRYDYDRPFDDRERFERPPDRYWASRQGSDRMDEFRDFRQR